MRHFLALRALPVRVPKTSFPARLISPASRPHRLTPGCRPAADRAVPVPV